tara:strand:+ start:9593 stop:10810 length:1218 start_codon:yes stop_codon:yes gene_type:complete
MISPSQQIENLFKIQNLLLIQDIDGVCIPLVKDPLERELDSSYIIASTKIKDDFAVLTNGEHEGARGVNRIIERSIAASKIKVKEDYYLPGLASGGIEYQSSNGKAQTIGVSKEEIDFLDKVPKIIKNILKEKLKSIFPDLNSEDIYKHTNFAVLDTRFTPTLNLNGIFSMINNDINLQKRVQCMAKETMDSLMSIANECGFRDSFYLHIAPNLGKKGGKEILKLASSKNIGTTDIQFMLTGARKEVGVLILLEKYIFKNHGINVFGKDLNIRNAPDSIEELVTLCHDQIPKKYMPVIVGVGDTITSSPVKNGSGYLRGGSDRAFLTLIQNLGFKYNLLNQVFVVDSSKGEVMRPTLSDGNYSGISDPYDPLKFSTIFKNGPTEYIDWFKSFADRRYDYKAILKT